MEQNTPTRPESASPPATTGQCENCGAPLYGRYCYACGQPIHGLVRHFSSVLSDVADSVLNIDERLFRTLGPLYFRPGKLTLDYFAGKRARYVTPFRMVFFLAIVAFFSIQLGVRAGHHHMESALRVSAGSGVSITPSSKSTQADAKAFANGNIAIDDKVIWNGATKPLRIGWLPDVAVDWLNDLVDNAQQQIHGMNSGTWAERQAAAYKFMLGMISAAPTVLILLLPVFALILKVFYIFKRRLYMEHLIVAMHSHAFLLLSILVLFVIDMLHGWVAPHGGWLGIPFGLLTAAVWIWIFLYLFLMQKRVYRQGWIMTTLKFWWIGICYAILLLAGFTFVALLSLTGA